MKYLGIIFVISSIGCILKRFTDGCLRSAEDYKGIFEFLSFAEIRMADFLSPLSEIIRDFAKGENVTEVSGLRMRLKAEAGSPGLRQLQRAISDSLITDDERERLNCLFSLFGNGYIGSVLKRVSEEKDYFKRKSTEKAERAMSLTKASWCVFSAGAAMLFIIVA